MKSHFITLTIQLKVVSNLSIEDVIEEISQDVDYTFKDTENVTVKTTEILEVI